MAALVLFVVGFEPAELGTSIALISVQLGGQLVAGYVGGRFAMVQETLHGSWAAVLLYVVTASIGLAAGGDPSVFTLVFGAAVALVLGMAGGALAAHRIR